MNTKMSLFSRRVFGIVIITREDTGQSSFTEIISFALTFHFAVCLPHLAEYFR